MHLSPEDTKPGLVLEGLVRFLVPVIILVTGYILWLGSHAAGGAFQAGALLAGAGVLMLVVSREKLPLRDGIRLRTLLVAGPVVFTLVAGGLVLLDKPMLQYPRQYAGSLILLIEAASTVTIGITLTLLFAGGRPHRGD
jgi:multisubunit Na+/H+ antiporter MnhB subunit